LAELSQALGLRPRAICPPAGFLALLIRLLPVFPFFARQLLGIGITDVDRGEAEILLFIRVKPDVVAHGCALEPARSGAHAFCELAGLGFWDSWSPSPRPRYEDARRKSPSAVPPRERAGIHRGG
jgi:hypothetical protein